jgi:integrase/recombinase XerD
MLHNYFTRMAPVERVRGSWLREPIERYVVWMAEHGYAVEYVRTRIQLLTCFGDFARERGAISVDELPQHIEPFVDKWIATHRKRAEREGRRMFGRYIRRPIQHMLTVVIPEYSARSSACLPDPFVEQAPGYFRHLRQERGLSDGTIVQHRQYLRQFETYLLKNGLIHFDELSPTVISAFVTESGQKYSKKTVGGLCRILKTFLSYLHREMLIGKQLNQAVEAPRLYRLSHVPRSISWEEVRRLLESVDRRCAVGKRDYAVLLLLVTYGLRAREVAALTLDNLDWQRARLYVPYRKAGHSTAYPLSPAVGNAIVDYLRDGRPKVESRRLFVSVDAPHRPATEAAVSLLVRKNLRRSGIQIHRPGSHTLRHTCVQHLLEADFSLKTIGDYVGHKSADATQVYTKIDIEKLREVCLGDGEAIL